LFGHLPRGCDALGSALDRSARGDHRRQRSGYAQRAARGRNVPANVVFASSSSVYGDQETFPLREDMASLLRSPYAASKLAGEAYCRSWWLSFGVPTVSLRYFNVYGPGQDPENEYAAVVPRFVMACMNGTAPEVHGDGEQSRDFTYIDDVIEANLLAGLAPEQARGRVMNVGGGREPTSVNRILEIVAGLIGVEPEPVHTPSREGDVRKTEADVSPRAASDRLRARGRHRGGPPPYRGVVPIR